MATPILQPSGSVRQLIVNADDYGLTHDVYREVLAQAEALRGFGVTPSHWDGHRAVAFWPWFCKPAARAAAEAGILRVRSPRVWVIEPGRDGASARLAWRLRRPRRLVT